MIATFMQNLKSTISQWPRWSPLPGLVYGYLFTEQKHSSLMATQEKHGNEVRMHSCKIYFLAVQ